MIRSNCLVPVVQPIRDHMSLENKLIAETAFKTYYKTIIKA